MTRRTSLLIAGTVLFSMVIILVLHAISAVPFRYRGGFTRVIMNDVIHQRHILDLEHDSYYIAGMTENRIYFGSFKSPLDLLITDSALSRAERVVLQVDSVEDSELTKATIQIDSRLFYVKSGSLPAIFRGKVGEWKATQILKQTPYFNQAIPIELNSIALHAIGSMVGTDGNQNLLGKVSATSSSVYWNDKLLNGQKDRLFSELGNLHYGNEINRLVYLYTYRNEYTVLDTNLNLVYRANTIDTISHAHIRMQERETGAFSLASEKATVNKNSQILGKRLFVNSNLMATNEKRADFDNSSVIDVYDMEEGKYIYSFYIPKYNKSKIRSFRISDKKLIVVYEKNAVIYDVMSLIDTIK